jgi:hypothetical protein
MPITLPVHHPTLRERVAILMQARHDEAFREQIKARCAEDIAFFIQCFGFTFDPRPEALHDLPFVLYPFQLDIIHWLDQRLLNNQDGIIEKSRDMGVTWLTLCYAIHKWLYRPGTQILIGSRKEDLVDNWTLDSHFGKIEYFLSKLPYWMLPTNFHMAEHRMKLKLMNPANGNVIIGESANAEFSRQGRYTLVFFDEAAFWSDLQSSFRAAGGATNVRILVSTPNGYNTFARLRFDTINEQPRYPVFTCIWWLHPLRKPDANGYSKWYEEQKRRLSPEDLAQEVDISYHRSARGVVYPGIQLVPTGDFPYLKPYSLFTAWDFGIADDTAIVWIARNPVTGKIRIIDCYRNAGKPIDFYLPFVLGAIPEGIEYDYTYDDMVKISQHASLPRSINFGDPDVSKRSLTSGLSALDIMAQYQVSVFTNPSARDFHTRKIMAEQTIKQIEGINFPQCAEFRDAMLNARFPIRSADSKSTAEVKGPIHDWTSHFRSAFEYYCVNQPPVQITERPLPHKRQMAYNNHLVR